MTVTWLQITQIILWPLFLFVVGALYRIVWARVGTAHKAAVDVHEKLADYKLQVAKEYATIGYLQDVDNRIDARLKAIETKLDRIIEHWNKRGADE